MTFLAIRCNHIIARTLPCDLWSVSLKMRLAPQICFVATGSATPRWCSTQATRSAMAWVLSGTQLGCPIEKYLTIPGAISPVQKGGRGIPSKGQISHPKNPQNKKFIIMILAQLYNLQSDSPVLLFKNVMCSRKGELIETS